MDHRLPQTTRQVLLTLQPWTSTAQTPQYFPCLPQNPRSEPVSTIILVETQSNLLMICDYSWKKKSSPTTKTNTTKMLSVK